MIAPPSLGATLTMDDLVAAQNALMANWGVPDPGMQGSGLG